jgi:hypothetical protein
MQCLSTSALVCLFVSVWFFVCFSLNAFAHFLPVNVSYTGDFFANEWILRVLNRFEQQFACALCEMNVIGFNVNGWKN